MASSPAPQVAKTPARGNPVAGLIVVAIVVWLLWPKGTSNPSGTAPQGPAAPAAAPITLLDLSGSGIKNSTAFTTTDAWTLHYTYDCSGFFGGKGNFQVYVYQGTDPQGVAANELGATGISTSAEYVTGQIHLEMNSECTWHVRVTQP